MKNPTNVIAECLGPDCGIDADFRADEVLRKLREAGYLLVSRPEIKLSEHATADRYTDPQHFEGQLLTINSYVDGQLLNHNVLMADSGIQAGGEKYIQWTKDRMISEFGRAMFDTLISEVAR